MHIKFKGMERRAPCKRIFCPYTHMTRGVRSNGQNFFSECGHVAYPGGGGGGGGGTQIFTVYVGSDPASTVHPKKISGVSSTPKKYLKF